MSIYSFMKTILTGFFQFTVNSLRNNPLFDVCLPPDKITSPLIDTLGLLKVMAYKDRAEVLNKQIFPFSVPAAALPV